MVSSMSSVLAESTTTTSSISHQLRASPVGMLELVSKSKVILHQEVLPMSLLGCEFFLQSKTNICIYDIIINEVMCHLAVDRSL